MIGKMEDLENINNKLGSDFPWTLINAYFSKEHLQQLEQAAKALVDNAIA